MKTKRAYYTCPILAALAAKHFGMKFGIKFHGRVIWDCLTGGEGRSKQNEWRPLATPEEIFECPHDQYYIHPDSMRLLEPVMGDIVQLKDNHVGWVKEYGDIETAGDRVIGNIDQGTWMVLQRNGMPFPWPEFEEMEND